MKRIIAVLTAAAGVVVGLSACGAKPEPTSAKDLADKCRSVSEAVSYDKKRETADYMSILDKAKKDDPLPGLTCLADTIGFTPDDIANAIKSGGKEDAVLEKHGYSIGIVSTGQNVVLVIRKS